MSKSTQRTFFGGYCDTFLYVHDRATHARKPNTFHVQQGERLWSFGLPLVTEEQYFKQQCSMMQQYGADGQTIERNERDENTKYAH